MRSLLILLTVVAWVPLTQAQTETGVCRIAAHAHGGQTTADVLLLRGTCTTQNPSCASAENSTTLWSRVTGLTTRELERDGTQIYASLDGDPGVLHCNGTVMGGVLLGTYEFLPKRGFLNTLEGLGFDNVPYSLLETVLLLDVTANWIRDLQAASVKADRPSQLVSMKALGITEDYARCVTAESRKPLRPNQVIAMRMMSTACRRSAIPVQ